MNAVAAAKDLEGIGFLIGVSNLNIDGSIIKASVSNIGALKIDPLF